LAYIKVFLQYLRGSNEENHERKTGQRVSGLKFDPCLQFYRYIKIFSDWDEYAMKSRN